MNTLLSILNKKFGIEKLGIKKIENVVMDSRKIEKNSLFFAINNGNSYIQSVLDNGAAMVVADNYHGDDKRVIKVEDTIVAMQEIAKEYRKALDLKIVAITGSNGKTTTKDIVYSVLKEKYRCRKTLGNYNNHIGVPYTILQCDEQDEVLILEMGMSNFGEIDLLCKIALPDYGIITNIGDSHLEFLKNRENVCKAKTEMLKYIDPQSTILFGDDYYLKNIPGIKVGCGNNNDFQIKNIIDNENGVSFEIGDEKYFLPLNGTHNAFNAAMAVVVAKLFKMAYMSINKGLEALEISAMRFQKIEKGEIVYINDAYNASPISMDYSLETFSNLFNDKIKIAALGDMLELGEKEIEYHRHVINKAISLNIDKIFLYGQRMKEALGALEDKKRVFHFDSKDGIAKQIESISGSRAVLLKGSRGMRMEEIIK